MNRQTLINAFSQLGQLMRDLGEGKAWDGYRTGITEVEYEKLQRIIVREHSYNGWFTQESVRGNLMALGDQLTIESLTNWLTTYKYTENPRTIAVIMAGNIPLVGFHDFLCVLMSGNKVLAKLSSDDSRLLPALTEVLIKFTPEIQDRIAFASGPMKGFDAVIATGSDNSSLYFEQYFGKYPHVFRKNRTSVAILTGSENEQNLVGLGRDIFEHFGLGCRNVSHLILPEGYDLDKIFGAILVHHDVIHNNKYANNYDYNKAVNLLNKVPLLDNEFVLLKESRELFSPLAVVHYHYYSNINEVNEYLIENQDKIQVIVGEGHTPFGVAQCPMLSDYADGVDTMEWLNNL